MTNKCMIRFLVILVIIFKYDFMFAQLHTASARSISLGSTGVSLTRGIEAINTNPANLAFYDRKNWEFSIIPQVYTDFNNSAFSYGTYKKYFTGDGNGNPKYLNEQDKNDLLSLFPNSGSENITNSNLIDIFNISVNYKEISGGFGISI